MFATGKRVQVQPEMPESRIVRPAQAPIAYTPFPIVDNNGTPVSPDAMIYDPYQKKKVNAGQYWAQVDKIEQSLNAHGQTLRTHVNRLDLGRLRGSTDAELRSTIHAKIVAANVPPPGSVSSSFALLKHVIFKIQVPAGATVVAGGTKKYVIAQNSGSSGTPVSAHTPAPTPTPYHVPSMIGPTPKPTPPKLSITPPSNFNGKTPMPNSSPFSNGNGGYAGGSSSTPAPYASAGASTGIFAGYLEPKGIKGQNLAPVNPLPPDASTLAGATVSGANFQWNPTWGDDSTAAFYINAGLSSSIAMQNYSPTTLASVAAGAYVLGGGGDIISATANMTNDAGTFDIEFLGSSIYSKSGKTSVSDSVDYNETFISISVPIPILIFTVTVTGSAAGDIGMDYNAAPNFFTEQASITPHLSITATFTVDIGLDIVIASAGVGIEGNIAVAQFSLPIDVALSFGVVNTRNGTNPPPATIVGCQLVFGHQFTINDTYALLAGNAGINAQACVIFFGCDNAYFSLYSWPGITGSDSIYNDSGFDVNVGPYYTDLPEYGIPLTSGQQFSADDSTGQPQVCDSFNAIENLSSGST